MSAKAFPSPWSWLGTQLRKLPGASPILKVVRYESEKQRIGNSELMLKTAWSELKRVCFDLERLGKILSHEMRHGGSSLMLLEKQKAAERGERIARIGSVLAHTITLSTWDFDRAEEMLPGYPKPKRSVRSRFELSLRNAISEAATKSTEDLTLTICTGGTTR